MRKILYILIFLFLSFPLIAQDSKNELNTVNAYFELDQMFAIKLGVEYNFNQQWGVKGALGASVFDIKVITYNLMGVYHIQESWKNWDLDFEYGVPQAYFDQLENRYVDWDPIIDDPYAGWLFGANILISYQTDSNKYGLRLGLSTMVEHQRDSGWKGPALIPIVALVWDF